MTIGLLTVLGAGLLTFLTPCVLPVVPIYLAALVGGDLREVSHASRGKLISRAALFSLGFILVFVLMGVGASSIGAVLSERRAVIQAAGAALVLLLALKFLGVIRIPWLDRTLRADDSKLQGRFGAAHAVIMGVLFAAGWSPCVGPVLGSVLTYTASTTSSPAVGALYLGVYGIGFALPLLAVAAFAEAGLRVLTRLRGALPKLEKATGVLLIAVAALLAHDAASGWPEANAATAEPIAPESTSAAGSLASAGAAPEAYGASNPTLTALGGAAGMPLMVELYAANCPVCQRMKPLVDSLTTQCDQNGVRVRAIDVSRPVNRDLVRQFRIVGVPTFLFLDEQGNEVARLVGEQPEATLRQALSALRGEPCPGLGQLPPGPNTPAEPIAQRGSGDADDARGTAPDHAGAGAGEGSASCGLSATEGDGPDPADAPRATTELDPLTAPPASCGSETIQPAT